MSIPFGVLVVGAGDMGARHAGAWARAGTRVVGVVDPDGVRAQTLAERFGAQAFPDVATALARAEVDVVSVCTPTFLHAEAAVTALEAGKHVLCEKPVALTMADAERMLRAERASGRRLRIGFMRRFDPASHRIRDFCRRLGGPLMAQATIAAGIRPKLLMHDARANGGPIIDMCCHVFDEWALLFGERPERVTAHGATFGRDKLELAAIEHKALDSAFMTLEYPSGGIGQIQVSWGLPRGIPATETHTYLGPEGVVRVDWPRSVTLLDGQGETRFVPPETDAWERQVLRFREELSGVAGEPLATVEEGIAALRTSLAALASIAERRPVRVEEAPAGLPDVSAALDGERA